MLQLISTSLICRWRTGEGWPVDHSPLWTMPWQLPSQSHLPQALSGEAGCPSKNCRVMDSLLSKLLKAIDTETRLANTGSAYLHHLSHNKQVDHGGLTPSHEVAQVPSLLTSLMKEQAEAADIALSSFWGMRCHLSLSWLPRDDRKILRQLIEPSVGHWWCVDATADVGGSLFCAWGLRRPFSLSLPGLPPLGCRLWPGDLKPHLGNFADREAVHRGYSPEQPRAQSPRAPTSLLSSSQT